LYHGIVFGALFLQQFEANAAIVACVFPIVWKFWRLDFLLDLQDIRRKAFKETAIKSSFKRCGIWSFELVVVLNGLKPVEVPYQSPTRLTFPTAEDTAFFATWPDHLRPRDPIEDFAPKVDATGIIRSPKNTREFMALGETVANELVHSSPEAGLFEVSMTIKVEKRAKYDREFEKTSLSLTDVVCVRYYAVLPALY
jgi:hypothetical protein